MELYEGSFFQVDSDFGRTARVYLTRGVKQGDCLSPLLFDLIFDAMLRAMAAMEEREATEFDVALPARAYADDLTMQSTTEEGSVALMGTVERHCEWSGKLLKVTKCEASGYDYGSREALDVSGIRYQGLPLRTLSPVAAF